MIISPVLTLTSAGLYCPQGDFYIDPWRPVRRAVITHAHSDHARKGHGSYLCHPVSANVLRLRLGRGIALQTANYDETIRIGDIDVALFPAGHIPGSAQIRLSHASDVSVITGDYKIEDDGISTQFTPVKCNTLISESTFGLPIFRWEPQERVCSAILEWWKTNTAQRKHSILECYSLGKAQRLVTLLEPHGQVLLHPTIWQTTEALRLAGVPLPSVSALDITERNGVMVGSLIIAPPGSRDAAWSRKLKRAERAFVSGWMLLRRRFKQSGNHAGFVLSDHADYAQLIGAIRDCAPDHVYLTHGYSSALSRVLQTEHGLNARTLATEFQGDAPEQTPEDV